MSTAAYIQPYGETFLLEYPETTRVLTQRLGFLDWLIAIYLFCVSATDVTSYYFFANYYFLFILALMIFTARSYNVEKMPEFWLIFALIVWDYLTAFISDYFGLCIYIAWYETKIFGGFFVMLIVCNSLPKLKIFMQVQILGTLLLSLAGSVLGFSALHGGGERITAAQAEPNAFGWQITYAFIASLIVLPLTGKLWKLIIMVFFGSATVALLAAGSRGSATATFSALVFYFLFEHVGSFRANWKYFLPVGLLIALPIVVAVKFFPNSPLVSRTLSTLTKQEGDVAMAGRDQLVFESFRIFLQHPVFGAGPGAYAGLTGGRSVSAHNGYSELLYGTGIIGFFLYFSMIALLYSRLRQLTRCFSDNPPLRKMFKASKAGVLALLVLCFFNEINRRKLPNMQLGLLIGFSARLLWAMKDDAISRFYYSGTPENQELISEAEVALPIDSGSC